MAMSRKDYELIASAFADTKPRDADPVIDSERAFLATVLSAKLANDNPRFNRDTFLRACGVQS